MLRNLVLLGHRYRGSRRRPRRLTLGFRPGLALELGPSQGWG